MPESGDSDNGLFDVIIIGGGITGAGTARDASLRGLSCLLLEKGDFASGVTSKSTRLIHGGLRYLANFEIDLVAESLRERAVLRRMAPHLIRPIPLIIPIYRGDPHGRAVISLGIRLYDMLSHDGDIPHYFTSGRDKTLVFAPSLNPEGLSGSALFYDHQIMMPERLVLENIISAREAGARLLNYTRAEKIEETNDHVVVTARDVLTGRQRTFRSRIVVNAAGPWIDSVRKAGNIDQKKIISPTKGIHLVMPKLSEQALFITSRDSRMFFIVPFGDYSLIGTTDTKYDGDLDDVHADGNDVNYLLTECRRILPGLALTRNSVLYTYAGIRPLAFSGKSESKISRKHRVIRDGRVITIAGGKLTIYRKMAKDAADAACSALGLKTDCVTDKKTLPGSLHMPYEDYVKQAVPEMKARHRLDEATFLHLIRYYGSRAERVLELAGLYPELARQISPESRDIYAQVVYSIMEEGARNLSDIILRRMHLGTTGTRGVNQIETIAATAGEQLKWNAEETAHQVASFRKELSRDTECLRS